MDWIITGASRGIGAALVRTLLTRAAQSDRFFVLARDIELLARLADTAPSGPQIIRLKLDLSNISDAHRLGSELASRVSPGAVLVHNAGLWPTRLVVANGLEAAFAVNCLGPLVLQAPLLKSRLLARVLVVSAGLIIKGRFDRHKTPIGADFSVFRTYCTTKLAGASAMRDVAKVHPQVDFAVVHPGVVNTDLGARGGVLGWLMSHIKRRWETPEACAARLAKLLAEPRWEQSPGDAPWYFEASEQPWPTVVERDAAAVREALTDLNQANYKYSFTGI